MRVGRHGLYIQPAGHGYNLSMREIHYELCDVFTHRPLAGNALAVFTDANGIDAATMQALARETNLSESSFVLRPTSAGADAAIRIFTPTMELPFAGHPTLGTAIVLAASGERTSIRLETGRGVVAVRLSLGVGTAHLWMDDAAVAPNGPLSRGGGAAGGAGRIDVNAARGALRQWSSLRLRRARDAGRGRGATAGPLAPGRPGDHCLLRLCRRRRRVEVPRLRPRGGNRGGPRDRRRGGTARGAPGPPWPHRVRRRDRHRARGRDRATINIVRARAGRPPAARQRRGRRASRHRGTGNVQAALNTSVRRRTGTADRRWRRPG